ncbi:hypothetical protein [Sphingorhabdus sp. Alg239-R122]|uniref:hypothetical protein n=1 Tax=Sphingorhabdus sp. Alg239-R122 TaxID=2305989 RepID=UPI0019687A16|nr:hypothetical protein [Sphingorhabdus sp. Alg239-R122]
MFTAVSLTALPAQAQNQSPPPLRDFSLEPQPKQEAPSKVQGPVVDGQRPRDLSQPQQQSAPSQTSPQVQSRRPAPSSSSPATVQPLPEQTRNTPSRTAPARTAAQAPARPPVTPEQQDTTPAQPADGTVTATQEQGVPGESAARPSPAITDTGNAAAPEPTDNDTANNSIASSLPLWAYMLGALVLLAAMAWLYLRRRKNAPVQPMAREDEQAVSQQPSPPVTLNKAPKKPAPAPQTERNPAPQPAPAMPSPAFSSVAGSDMPGSSLAIEFIAESAGATLMNAVLGYRITVRNGGEMATKLKLSGIMLQAANGSENMPDELYQPLHELEKIDGRGEEELKGEIRLPLTQIRPITYNRQALFVPVAHFVLEYTDGKGEIRRERHSFIVGREHEPPRAKMAPFRLDLGPRTFHGVGQRPLAI